MERLNVLKNDYFYGAAYYPEVVSQQTFVNDIKHMKKIGMNVIRIGEFFWSKLEPREGEYHLEYLENILKICSDFDMKIILGIPTATPPKWLTTQYPECFFIDENGFRMEHGSRQHICTNHPVFREKSCQLTEKIVETIKNFDNIIAIQLDNEFKCHVDCCYCEHCKQMWHQNLRVEYQTIERLNERWGTAIWSQEYSEFSEIPLPTKTPFLHNSSLQNSFRKFHAEAINDFAKELANILKKAVSIPITHNTALGFNLMNQELFNFLDIAGFDTYASAEHYTAFTMNIDLWRNIKNESLNEALLLETSTSHAGHIQNYVAPHPEKYLQTEVFTGFVGGLRAFCYWHFRGHPYGVEQPHSAVLSAWGDSGMGYDDVVASGELLSKLKPILSKTQLVKSKIAIVYSDTARRYFNIESGGNYQYRKLITDFYSFFIEQGISVELIPETYDFNLFDVVFVPFNRYVSKDTLKKMALFTDNGGHLVVGPMTGDRTEELAFSTINGMGILGEWLEIGEVRQYWQVPQIDLPYSGYVNLYRGTKEWLPLLSKDQYLIWAEKERNKGNVTVIGGFDPLYQAIDWHSLLLNIVKRTLDHSVYVKVNSGLKLYVREDEDYYYYCISNMTSNLVKLDWKGGGIEILNNESIQEKFVMFSAYENKIIKRSK